MKWTILWKVIKLFQEGLFGFNKRVIAYNFMQKPKQQQKTLLAKRYGHFVIHERKENFQWKILDHEKKFHPGGLLATGHTSSTQPRVESRLADVVSWLLLKKYGRTVGKSQGVEQALKK